MKNKEFLDYASTRYYEGFPIMSDEEFDKLATLYDYESVGAASNSEADITHAFHLYSQQKCYTDEPLIELSGTVIQTTKLDGAAVALYYVYGRLVLALTRGDGIKGKDITANMRSLVPVAVDTHVPLIQITGEVVAPKHIKNARNYAAGALGLKSTSEFAERELHFVAYGIHPQYSLIPEGDPRVVAIPPTDPRSGSKVRGWYDELEALGTLGFDIVPIATLPVEPFFEQFPTDGVVYRTNEYDLFNDAGFTAKHPRAAFALKTRNGGVYTTLRDVVWQVGRSGVITPVAIVDPVEIGGATVTKASLHNLGILEELGLEIGCVVEIQRAGEIIPEIIRRVLDVESPE